MRLTSGGCKAATSGERQGCAKRPALRVYSYSQNGNGKNGTDGHTVPPAWPGRAVIDPTFRPNSKAKVLTILPQSPSWIFKLCSSGVASISGKKTGRI